MDELKSCWSAATDIIMKVKNLGNDRFKVRQEVLFKSSNFKTAKIYYEFVKQYAIDTKLDYNKLEFTDNSLIIEMVVDSNGLGCYLWGQANALMDPETSTRIVELVREANKGRTDG